MEMRPLLRVDMIFLGEKRLVSWTFCALNIIFSVLMRGLGSLPPAREKAIITHSVKLFALGDLAATLMALKSGVITLARLSTSD
jgi:hypothetical protein